MSGAPELTPQTKVLILGVGGTLRPTSSGTRALQICLDHAAGRGAETMLFTGDSLRLPLYDPQEAGHDGPSREIVSAFRRADGIILASPGYHGGVSGTLKNVLDYTEELRSDPRCYFDGLAVGCIASAAGWQAAGATLSALRSIVHALRGWPTPIGVMLNSTEPLFDATGSCVHPTAEQNLKALADQVLDFALMHQTWSAQTPASSTK